VDRINRVISIGSTSSQTRASRQNQRRLHRPPVVSRVTSGRTFVSAGVLSLSSALPGGAESTSARVEAIADTGGAVLRDPASYEPPHNRLPPEGGWPGRHSKAPVAKERPGRHS